MSDDVTRISTPFSFFCCRWCGCLYGLPTDLASNGTRIRRCPNGHDSSGRTPDDRMRESEEALDEAREKITDLNNVVRSLRGQVTRLRKDLDTRRGK